MPNMPGMAAFYRDVPGLKLHKDEPGWKEFDASGCIIAPTTAPRRPGSDLIRCEGKDPDGNPFSIPIGDDWIPHSRNLLRAGRSGVGSPNNKTLSGRLKCLSCVAAPCWPAPLPRL